LWLFKASVAVLGFIVLLGEANNAIPELIERGEDLGLSSAGEGALGFGERTFAIVRYLLTEHFVLMAILVVGCGVMHHVMVGTPASKSKAQFNKRRNAPARKGKKK
jgi:hypothetical protein